jgi:hypothetical protein
MSLTALAYVSSAKHLLSEDELKRLLESARQRNSRHRVTGVLLYNDGSFLQYIEGPPEGLVVVFEHIRRASQHHDIIELVNGPVTERVFPDWLMGFTEPTKSELLSISQTSWQRSFDAIERQQGKSPGLTLLTGFWQRATSRTLDVTDES